MCLHFLQLYKNVYRAQGNDGVTEPHPAVNRNVAPLFYIIID